MDRSRAAAVLLGGLILALVTLLAVQAGLVPAPWTDSHEEARVVVRDETGQRLAVVDARVADTPRERRVGLGETDSLSNGSGMLFVMDGESRHVFVMRSMEFPIDIVYVAANGTVTGIQHARAPRPGENGEELRYPGYGKYVLEVPRGYTNATGIDEGDRVEIEFTG